MNPSIGATSGTLLLSVIAGVILAAIWAMANQILLLPVALLPAAARPLSASTMQKQIAIWSGVAVEITSNTGFSLLLCWATTKWALSDGVYRWPFWIAIWFVANAPLRWNLRDATRAAEEGNTHLLHGALALAYPPVMITTAIAIGWWAYSNNPIS